MSVWRLHSASHASRAVFYWAESRLLDEREEPESHSDWSQTTLVADDPVLPHLELDVDFFRGEDAVRVARLNEFGDSISFAPAEFRFLLLFDGETWAGKAAAAVQHNGRTSSGLLDVVDRAMGAGLCVSREL